MRDHHAESFAHSARREAERYESDSWVFLRELLQNARDAAARSVVISTGQTGGRDTITCLDDGLGMSLAHARSYLFTLYASSKEAGRGAAGRFGVGFWSILLFAPSRIIIESRPAAGAAWRIELSGNLERFERTASDLASPGTRITLERPQTPLPLARRVAEAASLAVRGLRSRRQRALVSVEVDGRQVNRSLSLPAPSLCFGGRSTRGVVALGSTPRVELYARGLHVRSATEMGDLLSSPGRKRGAPRFTGGEERGLAPQALLDGDGLNVLLARSDVSDDRALQQLVARGRRELARLVDHQIDALRPRSALRRMSDWIADRAADSPRVLAAGSALFGAIAVFAFTGAAPGVFTGEAPAASEVVVAAPGLALDRVDSPVSMSRWGYRDLALSYRGPVVDPVASLPRPALRYLPPEDRLYITALRVSHLDPSGAPIVGSVDGGRYVGVECGAGCVEIELSVADGPGALRVPVPTGHRLVEQSLALGGRSIRPASTSLGEPVIALDSQTRGLLRYRTSPGSEKRGAGAMFRDVPASLAEPVRTLLATPPGDRGDEATRWVAGSIRYSSNGSIPGGPGAFASRALAAGEGDCDVQNAVLAQLLARVGYDARLAIGFVGDGGVATDRLHAWVEYREGSGPWRVADASLETSPASAATSSPVNATSQPPAFPAALGVAGVAALLVIGLVALRHGSVRRTLRTDSARQAADLVRGALQHPDAFAGAPAVFRRRLLPTLAARPLTIGEAWDRAYRQRLFSAVPESEIGRNAARAGVCVLDTSYSESATAADLLGAVGLTAWDGLVRTSCETALLARANAAFAAAGEPWTVRQAAAPALPAVLELPTRVVIGAGQRLSHLLIVEAGRSELARASEVLASHPWRATLAALRYLVEILELPADRRAALLSPVARRAIEEA